MHIPRWVPLSAIALGLWSAGSAAPVVAQESWSARDVYSLARARNPTLRAAQSSVQATAAQEPGARLPADPQLQLGVMNASLPGLETDMPTSMAPSIQVMQMVPFPGKLALSGRIARQGTDLARARADETAWEVRSRAAMAFYEVYQTDRQIGVMRETLSLLQDFQKVARAMYAAGQGRQSDVLRADVEVARMKAEIARMAAMRATAAAKLNAVLDRPAETPVPAVVFTPLPSALPPADTLVAWAEASRPMLTGGRVAVQQAGTRLQLARRELWPDLSLGIQYGQRPGEMGTERMGSLMLGFSVPVFAGRRQMLMRKEAAAMQQMAEADLSEMRAQVRGRIGELTAELEKDRTLVTLYRDEVLPQAEANVQSSLASYRVGAVDFMTLVDAQMTVNEYRQELYFLLADYGRTLSDLEMTLGRELPSTPEVLQEER